MARHGRSQLSVRVETVRASILRALEEGPATARELSKLVGVSESDVPAHLEHLERSLRRQGERLNVEVSQCADCDFRFAA
jgi:predicted Zn-ribbon and HTH transcriptional regulator